jgi:DNA (cytosine-5)-methyltransferase 1
MARKILVADLLCGAGGSSTGCARAMSDLGLEMELVCVNHWPIAIDTHTRNHPQARHYCQDIATVRPHLIVPEGYLDLLMASPTCTHHSVARGGKPTSDQQRSDPWHIVTWMTELRVKRLIIENVWEFIGWGPIDHRTGKPIKSRKGEYFRAWIDTIRRLGFDPEWRKLNAADYGDATTRSRFILMARSDSRSISWPMPTHTKMIEGKLELFPGSKAWRPARDIIDWSIKGRSIFNRKKPLAPKTLARIHAGAVKFNWPEPFLVILRNHMAGQSVDGPLPTIAANGTHIGLAQPIIFNGRKDNHAKGVSAEPIPTLDTKGGVWLAEPFVMAPGSSGAPRAASEPLPTTTTGGAGAGERKGCARPMLIEPFILNRHGEGYGETRAHSVEEPAPTADCRGVGYLVEPFVLSQASGGVPRTTAEPLPTMATDGAIALISPYYGTGSGETCNSVEEPLPTVTSKGRFGMVVPVTNGSGGPGPRSIDDPVPTMTTAKGGEFAIVMPVTHLDRSDRARDPSLEPLPTVTGANRGELAFITAQFGERAGQMPRVHGIDRPAPAICATGHINLVEATPQYDILFRMLEPHELAAAMGFNGDEVAYEFAGTKTEKVKQIGNAVSVSKMKACVAAIMADAAKPAVIKKPEATRRAVA